MIEKTISKQESLIQVTIAGMLATGLLYLSQPPACFSYVAWVALVPLASLIHREQSLFRRDYVALWMTGSLWWMLSMAGIRHAHPALIPGWIALSLYLGCYVPLFVGLSRVAVWRYRWSIILAVPMVWVGLEVIRGYALSGFSAVMLGHTQAGHPWLIQIADLGGSYAVSFVVAIVSAALADTLHRRQRRAAPDSESSGDNRTHQPLWVGPLVIVVLLSAVTGYGVFRVGQADALRPNPPHDLPATDATMFALIQRNTESIFVHSLAHEQDVAAAYRLGSLEAIRQNPQVDCVVWPESTFTAGNPWRVVDEDFEVPPQVELTRAEALQRLESAKRIFLQDASDLQLGLQAASGREEPPDLIAGCSVMRYGSGPARIHSGVVWIDRKGRLPEWFGKRHLVMFGEYIPFGEYLPWLYEITPLSMGATPGDRPVSMRIGSVNVMPSVCFETMVEGVCTNHLKMLEKASTPADVIVNVTNDGWFNDSSILSHHLRCSQFVAVSHHIPVLIAANGGPTSSIDSAGRAEGLHYCEDGYLTTSPQPDPRGSIYRRIGDWPFRPLAALCIMLGIVGWRDRRKQKQNLVEVSTDSPPDPQEVS